MTRLFRQKHPLVALLAIWVFVSLFNVTKAFHIDDAFHLEAAQWIEHNPTKPMSGFINWRSNPEKIYTYNQPPLYFYMVAGVGAIFGYNEVALHLFQSLFTLLAIVAFYYTALLFKPNLALWLTAILAFNPAFIINQNVMTDMPLLALIITFILLLIKADKQLRFFNYAAFVLSIMLLIKYTILPLLVLLTIALLKQRAYRKIWVLFLPIGTLALWSWFNVVEFGQIHLFNRPQNTLSIYSIVKQALIFVACMGSILPLSFVLMNGHKQSKQTRWLAIITPILLVTFAIIVYFNAFDEWHVNRLLNWLFILNGGIISVFYLFFIAKNASGNIDYKTVVIILWILGIGAFTIIFAPFIATRHILLIIPGIVLLGSQYIEKATAFVRHSTLVISFVLGSLLGISDWHYADYYRQKAHSINLSEQGKTFTVGHWGWQWYSQKRGMEVYATQSSIAKVGDYIISALDTEGQEINDSIIIKEIDRIVEPISIAQFFSVNRAASFYGSTFSMPPWRLSKAPVDTIVTYQVIDIIK